MSALPVSHYALDWRDNLDRCKRSRGVGRLKLAIPPLRYELR